MYYVSLKQFEGPLDLLLHLITRAKVDIKDIFVSEITEQYLASMGSVDELDMDTASEFLTMAATAEFSVCLGMPQSAAMRFWVSGSHVITSAYSVQNAASDRPHRCAAAWYSALHSLNWRFVLSNRARAWDSFSSIRFPL